MMIMYFREIMLGKRSGSFIRQILKGLSLIYLVLIKMRICGYKHGFLRKKKLPVRVISVGNLTVGGSGKTPTIIEIASLLRDTGKRVGVLIRGYHSKYERCGGVVFDGKSWAQETQGHNKRSDNHQQVQNYKDTSVSPEDAGDEACLLSENLRGIPVLAGKNRWASGRYAIEEFGCDTLLLDDGFQHLKLYRDVDILLHDVSIPQAGLRLFPEGVMREPLSSMKRAQIIILTHTNMATDITPYEDVIKGLNSRALILQSIHLPIYFQQGMNSYPLTLIKGKTILACSGIGSPESFEHTLRQFEPNKIISLRFPDHYQYDSACLTKIEEMAKGTDMVVTTEKDMIRLAGKDINCSLFFLKIRLEIITPNWQENLLRCLCSG
ncbi:tetraacyldisaccharide 4'-kinase [bacterium]|nr:tetraacyldisaccharide 4'-kinase [bacterium]MBU1752869.1 tetraacyldisaccharide 4'-kinase [bacterium]